MRIARFIDQFGLTRSDVENWLGRDSVELRTEFAPTKKGQAREFTRLNVLELALVGALVSNGIRPSRAPVFAEIVIDEVRFRSAPPEWLLFAQGSDTDVVTTDNPTRELLDDLASKSPTHSVASIRVGEIARKVHQLFFPS